VETLTILTTTAHDRVRPFHDRMPLIVAPPDFAAWLDAARPPVEVERLFALAPAASLTATPVCGWVNDVRHQGPRYVTPCATCRESPTITGVLASPEPVIRLGILCAVGSTSRVGSGGVKNATHLGK
jgi:hypothetical protein